MAANQRPVANPAYENFEPSTEWEGEPTADVLNVFLPGFKREQLKVQVTSTNKLRISGERPIGINKWSRFEKELQIPSNCNTNETSAKFERGTLSIKFPKNIAPAAETQKPTAEAPKSQDQLPKQDSKPKPPTEAPIPQNPPQEKPQPPQEKVQPPRESVPKPTNDQTPQAPENKKQEEAVLQEAVSKTSIDKPKTENNVPKKEAEEKKKKKKESPSDHGKKKSSDVDSINRNPAKIDKPSLAQKDKQGLGGLMVEMKKPKKLMNMVVVVLFIVVIVLSAKSAIRSLVKSNTTETSSSDYQA
ncbi:heat shock family protein [Tripterygium wilfordii]|uniref:Heat shock family protein n=1 Tax=Tripterygium wilfordii TaxID=458696 RepID=A0A7J7E017_TRIWF|nr:inactive protein RESTRICTED TEV MOVEMENT 2-like [Tripterygium wilfordii]KAF5751666.1 heat shock family protein [Tripterygium wilfordii]